MIEENTKHFPLVPGSHKPNLDKTFLRQLMAIMRIAFPSWRSKEALILVMHSFFLVLRTVLSVGVARLDGRIVRDLVSADGKGFLKGLGLWFLLAIPSTYTNSMVRTALLVPRLCTLSVFPDSTPTSRAITTNAHAVNALH